MRWILIWALQVVLYFPGVVTSQVPLACTEPNTCNQLLLWKSSANSFQVFSSRPHHSQEFSSRILLGKSVLWSDIPYQILLRIKSESISVQHKFLGRMLKILFPGNETWREVWPWEAVNCEKEHSLPAICDIWKSNNCACSGSIQISSHLHISSCPSNWSALQVWLLGVIY